MRQRFVLKQRRQGAAARRSDAWKGRTLSKSSFAVSFGASCLSNRHEIVVIQQHMDQVFTSPLLWIARGRDACRGAGGKRRQRRWVSKRRRLLLKEGKTCRKFVRGRRTTQEALKRGLDKALLRIMLRSVVC